MGFPVVARLLAYALGRAERSNRERSGVLRLAAKWETKQRARMLARICYFHIMSNRDNSKPTGNRRNQKNHQLSEFDDSLVEAGSSRGIGRRWSSRNYSKQNNPPKKTK